MNYDDPFNPTAVKELFFTDVPEENFEMYVPEHRNVVAMRRPKPTNEAIATAAYQTLTYRPRNVVRFPDNSIEYDVEDENRDDDVELMSARFNNDILSSAIEYL